MTSEPQTESGRALLREVHGDGDTYRAGKWAYDNDRDRILAIEQEAARKAVAEVLDRLEAIMDDSELDDVGEAIDALIASEREQ